MGRMNHRAVLSLSLAALVASAVPAFAGKNLEGIACRSVHLGYEAPPATTAFYNEVRVRESAPGSYFMAAGWNAGYFGMQELGDGKSKVVIFSVWDSASTDDPHAVSKENRTKVVYHDPEVRIGRFGGEGTGGQSFFNYDWKTGENCRFVIACRPSAEAGRTEYTGFFYIGATKTWKRLVTFSTPSKHKTLSGLYSFVEDFKRDRKSTTLTRRAEFGPGFTLADAGWSALAKARFTADGNPVMNIDSGLAGDGFFLATGGPIANKGTPLWKTTELAKVPVAPADLAQVVAQIKAMPVSPSYDTPANHALSKPAPTPATKEKADAK